MKTWKIHSTHPTFAKADEARAKLLEEGKEVKIRRRYHRDVFDVVVAESKEKDDETH